MQINKNGWSLQLRSMSVDNEANEMYIQNKKAQDNQENIQNSKFLRYVPNNSPVKINRDKGQVGVVRNGGKSLDMREIDLKEVTDVFNVEQLKHQFVPFVNQNYSTQENNQQSKVLTEFQYSDNSPIQKLYQKPKVEQFPHQKQQFQMNHLAKEINLLQVSTQQINKQQQFNEIVLQNKQLKQQEEHQSEKTKERENEKYFQRKQSNEEYLGTEQQEFSNQINSSNQKFKSNQQQGFSFKSILNKQNNSNSKENSYRERRLQSEPDIQDKKGFYINKQVEMFKLSVQQQPQGDESLQDKSFFENLSSYRSYLISKRENFDFSGSNKKKQTNQEEIQQFNYHQQQVDNNQKQLNQFQKINFQNQQQNNKNILSQKNSILSDGSQLMYQAESCGTNRDYINSLKKKYSVQNSEEQQQKLINEFNISNLNQNNFSFSAENKQEQAIEKKKDVQIKQFQIYQGNFKKPPQYNGQMLKEKQKLVILKKRAQSINDVSSSLIQKQQQNYSNQNKNQEVSVQEVIDKVNFLFPDSLNFINRRCRSKSQGKGRANSSVRIKEICQGLKEISPAKVLDQSELMSKIKLSQVPQRILEQKRKIKLKSNIYKNRVQTEASVSKLDFSNNCSQNNIYEYKQQNCEQSLNLADQLEKEWENQIQECGNILYEILLIQKNIIHYRTRLSQKKREILSLIPKELLINLEGKAEPKIIQQIINKFQFPNNNIFSNCCNNYEIIQNLLDIPNQDLQILASQRLKYNSSYQLDQESQEILQNLVLSLNENFLLIQKLKTNIGNNLSMIKDFFKAIKNNSQFNKNFISCLELQTFLQSKGYQIKQHEMMLVFRVFNPESMTQILEKDFIKFFLQQ